MPSRSMYYVLILSCLAIGCDDDFESGNPHGNVQKCEISDDCPLDQECLDGLCTTQQVSPNCESGLQKCEGGSLYVCALDGWQKTQICQYGCDPHEARCGDASTQHEACNPNAIECRNGTFLYKCVDEHWILDSVCDHGCSLDGKTCLADKTCILDSTKCENDTFIYKCVDEVWVLDKMCANGCEGDDLIKCKETFIQCTSGDVQCLNSTIQKCIEGAWVFDSTCTNGCDETGKGCFVQSTCENGFIRCENGLLEHCSQGLWLLDEICTQGCAADEKKCNPICIEGELLCQYGVLSKCSGGRWSEIEVCQVGCAANGKFCAQECNAGQRRCNQDLLEYCNNGQWNVQEHCPSGCNSASLACSVPPSLPTRYLWEFTHSPITPFVVQKMRDIAAKSNNKTNHLFIKVGDSHYNKTFDGKFMQCFSQSSNHEVILDKYSDLAETIQYFQGSPDPYTRDSLSAVGGKSTRNMVSGSPSLIQQEITQMSPRFAFFGFGTNDMGNGGYTLVAQAGYQGYSWSLQDYYRKMLLAMEQLTNEGVIPLITGITPLVREPSKISELSGAPPINPADQPKNYVKLFNAVSRGVAEYLQVPFFNIYRAFENLPNQGMSSDGIHSSSSGSPCIFTESGLSYGVNQRNLGSMQMLSRAYSAFVQNEQPPDQTLHPFLGSGTPTDPFIINSLPYTHSANTKNATNTISSYSCSTADENGGEYYYKLVLDSPKRLKFFAVSSTPSVDVDIHLLNNSISSQTCIDRSDILFEKELSPGTYYIVIDTFKNSANAGLYLMGVL